MIKAVFLDFDGTVSDSRDIATRSLIRTLKEFGHDVDRKRVLELLGVKMGRMLEALGVLSSLTSDHEIESIQKKFYEYLAAAAVAGGIRPCCSLKALWKIKEDGLPLIIVSNSRTSFLRVSIETLEIEGLFDLVCGAEKFKFKNDMLSALFKRMGIKPSEAIYIGDRFSDVKFAREAGCVSVAIYNKCSFSTIEKIKEEKPDYIVRDFYELRKVIGKINEDV